MPRLEVSAEDGLTTIKMNDGKANIMNTAFLEELISAFQTSAENGNAVLLVSDIDGVYSAGFDTRVLSARDPADILVMLKAGGELLHAMLTHPRPLVVAASGRIFPMGLFTVLAADYRVGDQKLSEWCLNEARLGIVPPGYAFALLRYRLSPNWLSRAFLTSQTLSPQQGLEAGVFDELVSADELTSRSVELAQQMASLPPGSFAGIKHKLRSGVADEIKQSLAREQTLENYRKRFASMEDAGTD